MAKLKSHNIGPVCGSAPTATEARAVAERRAACVLSALAEGPAVLVPPVPCPWAAVLVCPSLTGDAGDWELIGFRPGPGRRVPLAVYAPARDGAVYAAVRTIAHAILTADTDDTTLDTLQRWTSGVLDVGQAITERADWERQRRQICAYRAALAEGKTEAEAHRILCETR